MSSFHDTSGHTSRNDSLPVESGSEYFGDEESILTQQDIQGEMNSLENSRQSQQKNPNFNVSSQPYRSRGRPSSGATGMSSDFYSGQTSYITPSDTMSQPVFYESEDYMSYDYDYDYDYDSLSYDYDYSAPSSARSGSEMSSTFASFLNQNELFAQIKRLGYFFRRPIFFCLFSLTGNGLLSNIIRPVQLWTWNSEPSNTILSAEALRSLSSEAPPLQGYPDVPAWLCEVRASIPAVVERPVAWILQSRGVPILSELIASSPEAASAVANQLHESTVSWKRSEEMVPLEVFLPIFTYFALYIASFVVAKNRRRNELMLFGDEVSQVGPTSVTESRLLSREYSALVLNSSVGLTVDRNTDKIDDQQNTISTAPASVRELKASERDDAPYIGTQKNALPKIEIPAEASKLQLRLGLTDNMSIDPFEESPTTTRAEIITHNPAPLEGQSKQAVLTSDRVGAPFASAQASDTKAQRKDVLHASDNGNVSNNDLSIRNPMQLRNHEVVIVLLGVPSVMEGNSVLVAALKYGVPEVLLPNSLANETRLMAVAETGLKVQFASDPLSTGLKHAHERALEVVAVHQTDQFAPRATPLYNFSHPLRTLYLFVSSSDEQSLAPDMDRASPMPVFVTLSRPSEPGVPVNECLYDRFRKEQK